MRQVGGPYEASLPSRSKALDDTTRLRHIIRTTETAEQQRQL